MITSELHPKGFCLVETLIYTDDNGVAKNIDCFDKNGESNKLKTSCY